jgi:hypothetical protein
MAIGVTVAKQSGKQCEMGKNNLIFGATGAPDATQLVSFHCAYPLYIPFH